MCGGRGASELLATGSHGGALRRGWGLLELVLAVHRLEDLLQVGLAHHATHHNLVQDVVNLRGEEGREEVTKKGFRQQRNGNRGERE